MPHIIEQLHAAKESLRRLYGTLECYLSDAGDDPEIHSDDYKTIRTLIDEAISKMETVEQSSEVDDNGAKPCPFEKMLWKGEPSHNPDKGWICDYNGVRITRLGGRKLYGDLIKTHNHAIEYLKSTNNTRAEPQTIEPIDGLEEAIDILEVHMADMGDMAVVLVAARAYLALTKRGG